MSKPDISKYWCHFYWRYISGHVICFHFMFTCVLPMWHNVWQLSYKCFMWVWFKNLYLILNLVCLCITYAQHNTSEETSYICFITIIPPLERGRLVFLGHLINKTEMFTQRSPQRTQCGHFIRQIDNKATSCQHHIKQNVM